MSIKDFKLLEKLGKRIWIKEKELTQKFLRFSEEQITKLML
jgi:hypothetical protein